MRDIKLYTLGVLILTLTACATVTPRTPTQTLAQADAQFTALTRTATDLIQSGTIHGDDAVHVQTLAHQGSAALDTAWTALGQGQPITDPYQALIDVNRALNAILQKYGESHG